MQLRLHARDPQRRGPGPPGETVASNLQNRSKDGPASLRRQRVELRISRVPMFVSPPTSRRRTSR